MSVPLRIRQLTVYPLQIPLRFRFEHAAASRDVADPVLVQVQGGAPFAQHAGFGETLARVYVTGENAGSVIEDVLEFLAPLLVEFRPTTFAEALEFIEALPYQRANRIITAARAAVELALLDLAGKAFRRRAADAAGWLGLAGFGPPGSLRTARYSGMVIGRSLSRLRWLLRLQRWFGLRDFKIKVAVEGWETRLAAAMALLKGDLARERVTLRADANGGWTPAEVREALPVLEACGVSALEQPLGDEHDDFLGLLAAETKCDLIADESLLTLEDARRLIGIQGVRVLNVRLAKNGGLLPSLQIAAAALQAGLDVQLGCLVGETSILTAAGAAFIEMCPKVRFVEGAFGPFLLRDDVTRRSIRLTRGGRIQPRSGHGLGIEVDEARIQRLSAARPSSVGL